MISYVISKRRWEYCINSVSVVTIAGGTVLGIRGACWLSAVSKDGSRRTVERADSGGADVAVKGYVSLEEDWPSSMIPYHVSVLVSDYEKCWYVMIKYSRVLN